jgi:metallo-beta-lactamase family protein
LVGYCQALDQLLGSQLVRTLTDRAGRGREHFRREDNRAQVYLLGCFCAHAGQTDLLNWFGTIAPIRPRVVLIHGEDGPPQVLAKRIAERHGLTSSLPEQGDVNEL